MTQYKRKINDQGVYQPFYGYTCVSMLNGPNLEKIEDFIRTSSLGSYFSPLPHASYHMTMFNIYCLSGKGKPIPSVKRWMEDTQTELPKNTWLPENVLIKQQMNNINVKR